MYPHSGCLLWACRSHLTLGVLQHVFGNRNASYENPFIQLYKYYTSYGGMEEMYREQKEGRLFHSLRPSSTIFDLDSRRIGARRGWRRWVTYQLHFYQVLFLDTC